MKNDFLIISFIGKDDKLGLMINKEFFIHNLDSKKIDKQIISDILNFLKYHNVKLDKNFSVIINQGPGSFSSIRISLAVAKGLKISKKIQLFGYKNNDLKEFNQENVEKLVNKNLIEKKLIKPIYLS
tara:strand:- start:29 stop:409 length:381 start_codon:yes stop_codon:yes gene_type:complete